MQLLLTTPHLTPPTVESLREYATTRFTQLTKLLPTLKRELEVRISVHKERHLFVVLVEMEGLGHMVVKIKSDDLRKAIDDAYIKLRQQLMKYKRKNWQHYEFK